MMLPPTTIMVAAAAAVAAAAERVFYVVLVDESQRDHARAAACTWLRVVAPPAKTILVTERNRSTFLASFRACSFRPAPHLAVKSLLDYTHVVRRFATALKPADDDWVVIAHAHTLVRPGKLAAMLKDRQIGDYAGLVRNASDGPQYLGYFPHVAPEHGLVLRGVAARKLTTEARRDDFDFRAAEFGAARLAAELRAFGITPTDSDCFRAVSGDDDDDDDDDWMQRGVTLGPLDPREMLAFGARVWGSALRPPPSYPKSSSSPTLAIAVLVRESEAVEAVAAIERGWGSAVRRENGRNSVEFFVSADVVVAADKEDVVRLALPPRPDASSRFYWSKKSFAKGDEWNEWLRRKVAAVARRFYDDDDHDETSSRDFVMIVDDDTEVVPGRLFEVLAEYDPRRAVAFGRKFGHVEKGALVGGGPGIVISRAALRRMAAVDCPDALPIISKTVPGGDGWLGQCFDMAGVRVADDWRFKSFPRHAYPPDQRSRFATFHRNSHKNPVFFVDPTTTCRHVVSHWILRRPTCAPRFAIIGAPKCGTTSLHYVLGQHPDVALPSRKELNFWGSPWSSSSATPTTLRSFLFRYLGAFPYGRVTGESSPDYFVSGDAPKNMLRFVPKIQLVISLRDPVDRAASAYHNKLDDKSLHRYLNVDDPRLDTDLPSYTPPSFSDLALDVNDTLETCPDYARHRTMREPGQPGCFVNPFVLHSYYAKYLRPWFDAFQPHHFLVLDYADLANAPNATFARLAHFLGLSPFPYDTALRYNTRHNRGVHPASRRRNKKPRAGGIVTATYRDPPGPWTIDHRTATILHRYFRSPNRQLHALLATTGHAKPSWLRSSSSQ
ncbi:hypothetical protein CTAYLR_000709 [Chrysophaeum taylorii]|uniref:Uncharacterized protein n=1 Tax=Chrysophaeum taylorii TaxID=2483200 RepID=A0AAD7XGB9_9STRA|nr:hypothetical protein CTAYLR_000709 [Chrysophaeum taylorii]